MMMLSSSIEGLNLDSVVTDDSDTEAGVEAERELRPFIKAVLAMDREQIADTWPDLEAAIGPRGVVDASGIVARFNGITRVADATGTQLDTGFDIPEAAKRWAAERHHGETKSAV